MKNYSIRLFWSDYPGFMTEARLKTASLHRAFIFKFHQSVLTDQSY